MFFHVVVEDLVVLHGGDDVLLHRVTGDVRGPRKFLPAGEALRRHSALGHRVVDRQQSLQRER